MDPWVQAALMLILGVFASSGFWTWVQSRSKTQRARDRLLLGLAYDKIATLGMHFIERGWLTRDEYEEYRKYLCEPYKEFGGNGVAEQIMQQVSQLPLRSHPRYVPATGRRSSRENTNG